MLGISKEVFWPHPHSNRLPMSPKFVAPKRNGDACESLTRLRERQNPIKSEKVLRIWYGSVQTVG